MGNNPVSKKVTEYQKVPGYLPFYVNTQAA